MIAHKKNIYMDKKRVKAIIIEEIKSKYLDNKVNIKFINVELI